MPNQRLEPKPSPNRRFSHARLGWTAVMLVLVVWAGCGRTEANKPAAQRKADGAANEQGKTAGIIVVKPQRRDIRMLVTQPGTIQAFEVTPIYSHISGYVEKYRFNIGDRVKLNDVLIDMWIPDVVEQLNERTASVDRATVLIRVAQSTLKAAEAKVETAKARIDSAKAGVLRAQASYTRWESEYKRLDQLVAKRVLDQQVRDETYRQFEEASAARDQANAMVAQTTAELDTAIADRERARVDVEAARADLTVAEAQQKLAKVLVDYGQIKAPYNGVITQRNVSPGDYLQPGAGSQGKPLFVLEQTDPVRVFVGVPELASYFIHDNDTALIRFQAIPGASREGKVVRSGYSLNPFTRTLQTEIDLANSDEHLHPGWYVTVTLTIDRKQVWTLPSTAIGFGGQQNHYVFLQIDGKPVRTPVLIGPSDDTHTEVLKKYVPNSNTNEWPPFDGTEVVMAGNLDALGVEAKNAVSGP